MDGQTGLSTMAHGAFTGEIMVRTTTIIDRNLLVVNVNIPGYPVYSVHIQMGTITVLPAGHRTEFLEEDCQIREQIKHIEVI